MGVGRALGFGIVGLLALGSCHRAAQTSLSPTPRPELVESLRADLAAVRHPADGGGRAWIEDGPARVEAGGSGRWTIVYEAGPLGVAAGGLVFLQTSPFWGWSTPQVLDPEADGYTEVGTEAAGVTLAPETLDRNLLGVRIGGRELRRGEQVRFVFGAGPAGAGADRFAERRSPLWIAVDGDGDGVRGLVPDPPTVEVVAGPPARLVLTLPSTARPGERVRLAVAVLDEAGNAGVEFAGEVRLSADGDRLAAVGGGSSVQPENSPPKGQPNGWQQRSPSGRPAPIVHASQSGRPLPADRSRLSLPPAVSLGTGDGGLASVEVSVLAEGVFRVRGEGPGGLAATSNPLVVSADGPRILWGDLHGHSQLSDGTGTPEDYFRYAREVAALDVAALTDHDHWGAQPLSRHPELWEEIRRATARAHQPGRFVTLLGYEWTNWLHGHRHVLYFADAGRVLSSVDPAFEHPRQLWDALAGEPALTFAHHSAGGPVATNWEIPPDPVLEPVTEVASVHGSSEAADSPRRIYDVVAGNFVRDALDRGYRLGFIGSGDSHDGHPGLAGLAAPSGGLAAILAEEPTRGAVLAALRARRAYATNGPRIVLRATLGGRQMGSAIPARDLRGGALGGGGGAAPAGGGGTGTSTPADELAVLVAAAAPLEHLDVIQSGRVVATVPGEGRTELRLTRRIPGLARGDYLYVRAVQADGGAAWSSPFFVE